MCALAWSGLLLRLPPPFWLGLTIRIEFGRAIGAVALDVRREREGCVMDIGTSRSLQSPSLVVKEGIAPAATGAAC